MLNMRNAERWSGDAAVLLRPVESAPRVLEAWLLDVSVEGIGLKTAEALALGAIVEVLLVPPDESVKHPERLDHMTPEPLLLGSGRVVRTAVDDTAGGFVCGICFEDCDSARIEALIESLKDRSLGYAGQV